MITRQHLIRQFRQIRHKTEELCKPLAIEDYVVQSIDDVSPPKWHLAHTTWFFETFILLESAKNYKPFHPLYQHLFNSYYQALGSPYPRIRRGILSRPTVETVYKYRKHIDEEIIDYIGQLSDAEVEKIMPVIVMGLNHEQQHQELLMMDIKHNLSLDPDYPAYRASVIKQIPPVTQSIEMLDVNGGVVEIGHAGDAFCFDNELPRHKVILQPYKLANRLVTNGEYCEFIEAGGYEKSEFWLSDGWDCVQKNRWKTPLYWQQIGNRWYVFTLSGLREMELAEPVSHVSYYEADAYARWRNLRLPTEAEWEYYVTSNNLAPDGGNFIEENIFHPRPLDVQYSDVPQQLFGDLWEWTGSPYSPYPGYRPLRGALGEYNGKFMSNQYVLRGGSCATPVSHIRASYRNFFQPDKRWQFGGIRLAEDA
jgi:ergothioneine biosynthesis protein EgtB